MKRLLQTIFSTLLFSAALASQTQPTQPQSTQTPSTQTQSTRQAPAKETFPIFEVSGLASGMSGGGVGGNLGLGGRVGYVLFHDTMSDELGGFTVLEAEGNWLASAKPSGTEKGGHAMTAIFGAKTGLIPNGDGFGFKAGAGFIRFDQAVREVSVSGSPLHPTITPTRFGPLTTPVVTYGFVIENYPHNGRWGMRFDISDLIVLYTSKNIPGTLGLSTQHNFVFSTAIQYRFPMEQRKK